MTPLEAKKVLEGTIGLATGIASSFGQWNTAVAAGCVHAYILGHDPATLEAIAMWMRDPVGVYGAKE